MSLRLWFLPTMNNKFIWLPINFYKDGFRRPEKTGIELFSVLFFLSFSLSLSLSLFLCFFFLVADTQLYKRLCPSVGPSVRWSVRPLVRPSVRWWARVEKWENERFRYSCECWGGCWVWMGVGCPCPPVRNDIGTPRHLFYYRLRGVELDGRVYVSYNSTWCRYNILALSDKKLHTTIGLNANRLLEVSILPR